MGIKDKNDVNNKLIYKARLTVKGCSQREGYDFEENFLQLLKSVLYILYYH